MTLTPKMAALKAILSEVDVAEGNVEEQVNRLEAEIKDRQEKIWQLRRLLDQEQDRTPTGRRRRADKGLPRKKKKAVETVETTAAVKQT